MPELPDSQIEVEKIVRAGIDAKFAGVTGLPHVLTHRVWIDGEGDAIARMGYVHPVSGETEFRLLVIDLAGFTDTDAGCEDKPVYYLNYTLQLSVSHADARSDSSTSTDDYSAILLTIRSRVLSNRHVADYAQLRCDPLVQTGSRFGHDEDETLIYGHHARLSLRVEVTPT
ncbi:MAG: hypothetical protein WCD76_13360 [Pyrinomonadaceae bacterium]